MLGHKRKAWFESDDTVKNIEGRFLFVQKRLTLVSNVKRLAGFNFSEDSSTSMVTEKDILSDTTFPRVCFLWVLF